jgi:hypothetical protein
MLERGNGEGATMTIKLAGRSDIAELLTRTDVLYAKLVHTPFLVFVENGDGIEVEIVDQASALTKHPRETKLMVQWRGEWRSDFVQGTVGDVLDALETNISGHKGGRPARGRGPPPSRSRRRRDVR